MTVDYLFADIGSTKTMVSAFSEGVGDEIHFRGQGVSATTVSEGDVCIGLEAAIQDLERKMGSTHLKWNTLMATCSAAGGLRMAAVGLVESMTTKAASEAALNAGAILIASRSGALTWGEVTELLEASPQIVLLAGGVDGGEVEIVVRNAKSLASRDGLFWVVFAGNRLCAPEVSRVFAASKTPLYITENVYPRIDQLNVLPARNLIQEIFEKRLVDSPGMEKVREMVDGPILPTPGAVMRACEVLAGVLGDLVVFDAGGATTDVHSVTAGTRFAKEILLNPEPHAKRTVEGDLGIYVNAPIVLQLLPKKSCRFKKSSLPMFPQDDDDLQFLRSLTKVALATALGRHVGKRKQIYTVSGEKAAIQGRDLREVAWVIGTGGALTRLGQGCEMLNEIFLSFDDDVLLPKGEFDCLIDRKYIMAAAGLMSLIHPDLALKMMLDSFGMPKRFSSNDRDQ
jgi:uncharacterized protein (TIGR01319 family)